VNCAYRALKPGGVLIASETGVGHEAASQDVSAKYDVTEKDMPPRRILKLGKAAGFQRRVIHPRGDCIGRLLFDKLSSRWKTIVISLWPMKYLAVLFHLFIHKRNFGLVAIDIIRNKVSLGLLYRQTSLAVLDSEIVQPTGRLHD
jgi:hypothetical protein